MHGKLAIWKPEWPVGATRCAAPTTQKHLEELFSSGSDRAYEIGRGQGHPGRCRFPVVLVTKTGGLHRACSGIIVVHTGKNDWVVDKLP